MGKLVDGNGSGSIVKQQEGSLDRLPRTFRDFVSDDHPVFKPESGKSSSYACPGLAEL